MLKPLSQVMAPVDPKHISRPSILPFFPSHSASRCFLLPCANPFFSCSASSHFQRSFPWGASIAATAYFNTSVY